MTELWLPPSAALHRPKPTHRCNFPGCDTVFYDGEERARVAHAREHIRESAAEIRADGKARQLESVYGEGDPEKQAWLKRRFEQIRSFNPKDY